MKYIVVATILALAGITAQQSRTIVEYKSRIARVESGRWTDGGLFVRLEDKNYKQLFAVAQMTRHKMSELASKIIAEGTHKRMGEILKSERDREVRRKINNELKSKGSHAAHDH